MYENEKNEIKKIISRIGIDEAFNILAELKRNAPALKFKIPCVDCNENLQIIDQTKNSILFTWCSVCSSEQVVYIGTVRLARQSNASGSSRRSVAIRSFDANNKERAIELYNFHEKIELKSKDKFSLIINRVSNSAYSPFRVVIRNETVSHMATGLATEENISALLKEISIPSGSEILRLPEEKDPDVIEDKKNEILLNKAKVISADVLVGKATYIDAMKKIDAIYSDESCSYCTEIEEVLELWGEYNANVSTYDESITKLKEIRAELEDQDIYSEIFEDIEEEFKRNEIYIYDSLRKALGKV